HIIPSIFPYSIRNDEALTISAVIKSTYPLVSVSANLSGLAEMELMPLQGDIGETLRTGEEVTVYSGKWVGRGLEEKVYPVSITATDSFGHSWTDTSLSFSDPVAGRTEPGSTEYPDLGAKNVGFDRLQDGPFTCAVIDSLHGYGYF